jgi:hypothetical protein
MASSRVAVIVKADVCGPVVGRIVMVKCSFSLPARLTSHFLQLFIQNKILGQY